MLTLVAISASNLRDVDFGSSNKSDPYVKATFRGLERKTAHIDDDLDPVWTEEHNNVLVWDVVGHTLSPSDAIDVQVKDWEKVFQRKILGRVKIPLGELLKTRDYKLERTYSLLDKYDRATTSKIVLRLEYKPSQVELETQQHELQYMDEESEKEEEEEDDEKQGVTEQRKRSRRRRGTLKKGRREWSTKKQHYKIRVTIHKGIQLPGVNISPITRITVKNQKHQTREKKSTNSPAFNQTFTFNFHSSEAELFDNQVVLEVFDSKKIYSFHSNRLLGFFETDIGAIYEFPGHAFIRKWVVLTGRGEQLEDETETKLSRLRGRDGEAAGYLKVTAMVLGPGDHSPHIPQQDNEEEEDIESNLLMPVGLVRQPAKFLLKVYQAEDLPRMDTGLGRSILRWFLPGGGKESAGEKAKLVDPYMVFSFCGKKVSTTTKYRNNNPTYYEMLTLPVMLPSMCEKIKLRFFDWDAGRNPDTIATSCLSLSEISGQDNESGFYPQFGPCFVNFYGSPREFSLISSDYKDLDKGIGEGAAYRGRVLVELTTENAGPLCKPCNDKLHDDDKIKIQPFLKQDHFKLFACFKDAAMISKTNEAIEFEVSIGNFGNTLDETAVSCNTPPTNPVYDGCHYHYLPWRQYKPCICLDCRWENIAFRIEPLNIINRLCENLEIMIDQVKTKLEKPLEQDLLASATLLKSCLQKIIEKCSNTDFLECSGVKNRLDYKIQKLRKDEFQYIVEDAKSEEEKLDWEKDQVNLNETMETVERFLQRLKNLAIEPQISMPDVIVWMLCGAQRMAYHRIPIQDVLYSTNKEACGKYCGKTVELLMKYPGSQATGDKEHQQVPAMVRLELWVGLREHQQAWSRRDDQEGKFKVYAETYENESRGLLRKWGKPVLGLRPHYSNANGDTELHKDMFLEPRGWRLSGEWKPILEKSVLYGRDYGLTIFTEELYEIQSRNLLGGGWNTASHWTEADGEPSVSPKDFPRPEGWQWMSKEWTVDLDRAVDEEGWEYSKTGADYVKAGKPFHWTRRRRWICNRELVDPGAARKQEKLKKLTEEGWEYGLAFVKSNFHLKPRKSDLVRRRRLLREMVYERDPTIKKAELPPRLMIKVKTSKAKKPRTKEKKTEDSEELLDDEDREGHIPVIPRMFVVYNRPHKFQLWVYIYQARDLLALDDSGMSDPYVRVAFGNQSKKTEWKRQTTSPTWDETLIFSNIEIFEKVEDVVDNPPKVIMEVFDWDRGKHDFIGRGMMQPLVQTRPSATPPVLQWVGLQNGVKNAGQVLVAAELFLDEGQKLPSYPTPKKTDATKTDPKKAHLVLPVRDVVQPELQTVVVEVLCWGVRNMKKYRYRQVNAPSVEFEWGDQVFKSEIENLKKCPNFNKPNLEIKTVRLPAEPFTPALNIRVYDNGMWNDKSLVGVHSISSLKEYYCEERTMLRRGTTVDEPDGCLLPSPERPERKREVHKKGEDYLDWWSKYYSSMRNTSSDTEKQETLGDKLLSVFSSGDEVDGGNVDHYKKANHDTLTIFPKELEKMEEFGGLEDFVTTFDLKRGKSKGDDEDEDEDEDDNIGQLKASFSIYQIKEGQSKKQPLASAFENLPETKRKWPIKCLVRVYVICAFDLQSHDPNGLADPYLVVSLGNKLPEKKSDCQHNTLKPVFGKMFDFTASIPTVKDLKVKVVDDDGGIFDETIGETVIDLEQRLLSRLHASCGLPKTYSASGPFAWRDSKRPKSILRDFCHAKGYKYRFYPKNKLPTHLVVETNKTSVSLSRDDIGDSDYPDQQLSLLALHRLGLIPEHVETRSLYSSLQPQIEQGKIQMWVDIFPLNEGANIRPAVRIEPREPLSYVLRVIIWDTTDVFLQDTSLTGEKMSDILVKGWIDGTDERQETDVHLRSLQGDGNFNWRMVFPFHYLPMEKKISISKKTKITHMYKTEEKVDPRLKIQIWDYDTFSSNDFLGTRTLELHKVPKPCKSSRYCGTKYDPSIRKDESEDFLDLFQCKSIRGWWGCWGGDSLTGKPKGKVDMSIQLLTEEEAKAKPAGKGRDEPNQHPNLPKPNRPKTSFLWFVSPFKTMRYIVWRNYKWYIIGFVLFVFLVLIIFLFVYSMPGYTVKKMFNV